MSSPSSTDQLNDLRKALGSICKQKLIQEVDNLKAAVQKDDPQAVIMSLPMLLALTICPAMLGTQEAIRQSQSKTKREEHRARRCNLVVSCVKSSIRSRDINNKLVVLKDSKLYIANEFPLEDDEPSDSVRNGYPFSGYFLPFPDKAYEGLVSTISDDPPMLNWIYVDKDTYEVKYGVRAEAEAKENFTGPFDCTKQDRRMTLEGWEGFAAVEELPGVWALYYDREDDGLKSKVPLGTRVLEVELTRREKKERKPAPDENQPMTLDEKMKQHKAQTRQEEKEREQFVSSSAANNDFSEHLSQELHQETGSARDPNTLDTSQAEALSEAMKRLGLSNGSLLGSLETSTRAGSHPPSVVTGFSNWSDAERQDEAASSDSVTVATSVQDHDDVAESVISSSEESVYKRPYVEDEASE
ncbi:Fc.00g079350.m01.CDS01 [Cosmosporella sp. VM-42]